MIAVVTTQITLVALAIILTIDLGLENINYLWSLAALIGIIWIIKLATASQETEKYVGANRQPESGACLAILFSLLLAFGLSYMEAAIETHIVATIVMMFAAVGQGMTIYSIFCHKSHKLMDFKFSVLLSVELSGIVMITAQRFPAAGCQFS